MLSTKKSVLSLRFFFLISLTASICLLFGCASPNSNLYSAAEKGDIKAMEYILESGNSADGSKSDLVSPLSIALKNKQIAAARLLIEKGADVNREDNIQMGGLTFLYSPLYLACQFQTSESKNIVSLLIEKGAQVNWRNRSGVTALWVACRVPASSKNDQADVVSVLLKNGANPNIANGDGLTPLHSACSYNYAIYKAQLERTGKIIADFLKAKNKRIDAENYKRNNKRNKDMMMAQAQLNASMAALAVSPKRTGAEHDVLVSMARDSQNDVLSLIMDSNHNRDRPAYSFDEADKVQLVKLLLEAGTTSVEAAGKVHNGQLVKLLLEAGANPDAKTKDNKTPIEFAREYGDDEVVQLLLEHGVVENK